MKSNIKLSPQSYRLLFNFIAILTLVPGVLIFKSFGKISYSGIDPVFIIIGILLTLLGLLIIIAAFSNYDLREFTGLGAVKPNEKLNIQGMNRHVRHPLYTGIFFVVWGIHIATVEFNFLIVAIVTTVYIFIGTKLEERKLVEQFGDNYLKYKKEVPMFFPWRK